MFLLYQAFPASFLLHGDHTLRAVPLSLGRLLDTNTTIMKPFNQTLQRRLLRFGDTVLKKGLVTLPLYCHSPPFHHTKPGRNSQNEDRAGCTTIIPQLTIHPLFSSGGVVNQTTL